VLVADTNAGSDFRTYLLLRTFTTGAALLAVIGIAFLSAYSAATRAVIIAVGIGQAIEGISDIYYGRWQKREDMRPIAVSMMARGILAVAALAACTALTHSVVWGTVSVIVVRAAVLWIWDKRQGPPEPVHLRTASAIRPQLRLAVTAFPLGVVLMLSAFMVNAPRYAIEKHLGLAQLGLFAAVSSLVSVGSTLMNALGNCVMPRLVRLRADHRRREFTSLAVALVLSGGLAGLAGTLVAATAGGPLLTILFRRSYAASQPLLVAMMIAGTISYLAQGAGYLATAMGSFWAQVPFVAGAALASSALSFMLVPRSGLFGGVVAVAVASAIQLVGTAAVAARAVRKIQAFDSMARSVPAVPVGEYQ